MKTKKFIILPFLAMLLASIMACSGGGQATPTPMPTSPLAAQSHIERGNEYAAAQQWDQAIAEYTKAIELDPDLTGAYGNRGVAYGLEGQHDQAIADFSKVIELNPNDALAYLYRGAIYAEQGKKAEAISDLEQCIAVSNDPGLIQEANDMLQTLVEVPDGGEGPKAKVYSAPPPMTIDTSEQYTAVIETEKGNLALELFASDVPVTVNNFVFLAREGFYDGTTFHRVEPGFVAQGGDPTGIGGGGPGYSFDDEFSDRTHVAGALSMANSGPNTNGSQFFITYTPQHHLDGKHSVFGKLIEGLDVLENIQQGDTIIRVTIVEE